MKFYLRLRMIYRGNKLVSRVPRKFMFANWLPFDVAFRMDSYIDSKRKFLPEFIVDFLYGIISGIPLCCIIYYSFMNKKNKHGLWYKISFKSKIPSDINYVPCPRCISKNRFKI